MSLLLDNYRGKRSDTRPVWFMRQAGRSLPEYRQARGTTAMLDACVQPELVAEITAQPVRRHKVDAGIFYSDIVVPVKRAGVDVEIVAGTGPVVASPIRCAADIAALPELDPAALDVIVEAARQSSEALGATPLIGFAGAPFTVASYLVEGRPSRDFVHTFALMNEDPDSWHALLSWVSTISAAFLDAQIRGGAQAVQLFDSWAGNLSVEQYQRYVQEHSAAVFSALGTTVPRVHFGTKTGPLLEVMAATGADVMGIDAQTSLTQAAQRLPGMALQGNIDPEVLTQPWDVIERHVHAVITAGRELPGHVVNLGHGVPPTTDPDVLTRIVELVHSLTDKEIR
ncbi:MAG: uroporphyrinogen decarboxylase [Propionibacteriaceae bacterium]